MEKELFEELTANAIAAAAHSRGEAVEEVRDLRVLLNTIARNPQAVLEANSPV